MKPNACKNIIDKQNGKKMLCYVLLGAFVFLLTSSLEYITDDWHFRFVFTGFMPGENETRVKNAKDVITSMQCYYRLSGGRVFAHGLLYFVLFLPKMIYNMLNAFVFVMMTWLTEKLSCQKREKDVLFLVWLIVLLFFFLPSFGDTCLWTSGSVNYLWMSLFPLLFLLVHEKGWWGISLPLALLSGFTNETTGGVLAVYLITQAFLAIWSSRKSEKLQVSGDLSKMDSLSPQKNPTEIKKMWLGILCQIACMLPGMFFILKAPGNLNRAQVVNQTKIFEPQVTFSMLGKTAQWIFQNYYFVMILFVIGMPIYFRREFRKFLPAIPYFIASIAGMTALSLSGTFLRRAQFLNVILLLIAFLITLEATAECIRIHSLELQEKFRKLMPIEKGKAYLKALKGLVCILFAIYFLFQFKCFFDAASLDRKRMAQIEQSVARGDELVTVSKKIRYTAGAFYPEESSISETYEVLWMGLYYGIEIRVML